MSETKVISFRVDERHYTMLAERAAAAGQSVGEFSRQLAIEETTTPIAVLVG